MTWPGTPRASALGSSSVGRRILLFASDVPRKSEIKAPLENVAARLGLYRPARRAFQEIFNRRHAAKRRVMRRFFAEFIGAGSVVFDVGANKGRLTDEFLGLGARVVAVEPNPALAHALQRRYGREAVVEQTALGSEPGSAQLHLGVHSGHSTLSSEWMRSAPTADRWAGAVEVPVITLDSLIDRHGPPDFVKVDVEGFELEVFTGLSRTVPLASFEFQAAAITRAQQCIDRLQALGFAEFNLAEADAYKFRGDWLDAEGVRTVLTAIADGSLSSYGDVYARASAR